jgi:hypothetical protein
MDYDPNELIGKKIRMRTWAVGFRPWADPDPEKRSVDGESFGWVEGVVVRVVQDKSHIGLDTGPDNYPLFLSTIEVLDP